jgi:hypothetical protein
MNTFIKKILREFADDNQDEKLLSKEEVRLFKLLNNKKQLLGHRREMIEYIAMMLKLMGKPTHRAAFYYEVYTQNYRPEGDYENLTKETSKDYRGFKQKKTPNNSAWEYTTATIPFKGSNLEGFWERNSKGEWYYVVQSWGWYPVFLFKNDQWYSVNDTYSSSTSKQMSQSRPRIYFDNLNSEVIQVSRSEMKDLINGKNLEDIESGRYGDFVSSKETFSSLPARTKTFGWGNDKIKATFKITNIDVKNDDIIFDITISKAGKVEGTNKLVPFTDGYPEDFKTNLKKYLEEFITLTYGQSVRKKNIVVNVNY